MKQEKITAFFLIFIVFAVALMFYSPAYNAFMLVKRTVMMTGIVLYLVIAPQLKISKAYLYSVSFFAVSLLLSTLFTQSAFINSALFFGVFAGYMFLGLMASGISADSKEKVIYALAFAGLLMSLYSLYQTYIIGYRDVARTSATIGNQNFLAGVLAAAAAAPLYLSVIKRKWWFLFILFIEFIVIKNMDSRGATAALAVNVIIFLTLFMFYAKKVKPKLILIAIAGFIILLFSLTSVRNSISYTLSTLHRSSTGFRFISYQSDLFMAAESPLIGKGLMSYEKFFPKYRRTDINASLKITENPVFAHNDYLQFWVELGTFGLASFLLIVAAASTLAKKQMKKGSYIALFSLPAMSAILTHSLVSFPLFRPASAMIFWIAAGFILTSTGTYRLSGLRKWIAAALFTIFLVLLIMRTQSSVFFNIAYHQVGAKPKAAYNTAHKASQIWPGHYKAYNFQGLSAKNLAARDKNKKTAYITKSTAAFSKVSRIMPNHSYYNFNLGQTFIIKGTLQKDFAMKNHYLNYAIHYLLRALALDQNAKRYYNELGLCYKEKGYPQKAISIFKKYIRKGAIDANPYINIGNIYFDAGKFDKAKKWYVAGLSAFRNSWSAYYYAGAAAYWQKNMDEAGKYWAVYVAHNPSANPGIIDFVKKYERKKIK